ncbi:hypothetical protein D9615_009436 [Tricholomella constricta]|uniref:Tc1-like transposase DDE domain-containing protein n=1 Tax=Tricholomella constricta TaxID=117010 RepID=A0A8H5GYA2_9AGAR|nr:hypothetical protein D9615_009436 [Tricholomella constricta]
MARSKPFSEDLRWVLVHMRHIQGLSTDEIAKHTGLKTRTIFNVLKLHKDTGHVMPLKARTTSKTALTSHDLAYVEACIERAPDAYLDEVREQLEQASGTKVSLATVWRGLRKRGFTLKQLSKSAMERNEDKRLHYIYKMGSKYEPNQLVFVDESSFDRRTTYRGRAWALKGRRAYRKCFYIRGKRYSILPALSLDGVINCQIVEGSYNTETFTDFISGLLDQMQPFPAPNSVIVMDNCRIHKAPHIIEMIEERGMKVEFLPAYSPDYNPIELAFSSIKAYLRRHYPHFARSSASGADPADDADVYLMLYEAIFEAVSVSDSKGYFRHSGYL